MSDEALHVWAILIWKYKKIYVYNSFIIYAFGKPLNDGIG